VDSVERAAIARGVELVEDLLLDAGRVRTGAIGDPAQQVGGCRTCARRGRVKYLDEEANVFRALQDDVFAAHGSHFHEVPPAYTSAACAWCPMPKVSDAPRFTIFI
jgi:hypothetical protein